MILFYLYFYKKIVSLYKQTTRKKWMNEILILNSKEQKLV